MTIWIARVVIALSETVLVIEWAAKTAPNHSILITSTVASD
jgi:hypothetical protein